MFPFFEQIGNFLGNAIDFVVSLFSNLVSFFQIIFTSFTFLVDICVALPAPIQAGCLCMVGVSVIYLVIGR